ncbi:hypothetical protein QMK33_05000 [Hymenobacter sp. H14-R3]|uniref:hypothetical protein n=1 Tax=Hymenobacter sp. H14-R3 TaxID=3046308 RepID=UPI0024B9C0E5|nr:hypothetical protein [Hymenobacter sp. H14-R3]MDJ0364500.1 hypothetical protein [Hymenobacter sp. H14-R3]
MSSLDSREVEGFTTEATHVMSTSAVRAVPDWRVALSTTGKELSHFGPAEGTPA